MSCGEYRCGGGHDECYDDHDGKAYDLTQKFGFYQYWIDCKDDSYRSEYETSLNVLPSSKNKEWNKVRTGSEKFVWLNSWLSQTPNHVIDEDCNYHCQGGDTCAEGCGWYHDCAYEDYYRVRPEMVMLGVQHAHEYDGTKQDFSIDPELPKDEDQINNDPSALEKLLVYAGTAAQLINHPVTRTLGAATTLWVAYQGTESKPQITIYDGHIPNKPSYQRIIWEIPLRGDNQDHFPQDICDSASAQYKLHANYDGDYVLANYTQYTWNYVKYWEDGHDYQCPNCHDDMLKDIFYDARPVRMDYHFTAE